MSFLYPEKVDGNKYWDLKLHRSDIVHHFNQYV